MEACCIVGHWRVQPMSAAARLWPAECDIACTWSAPTAAMCWLVYANRSNPPSNDCTRRKSRLQIKTPQTK